MSGHRVLVTGASRGIGRAVAELLYARGASVGLVARDGAMLRELARSFGDRAFVVSADLGDADAARAVMPSAIAQTGEIDGLVCCAGHAEHRPLPSIDETQIDALHAVHVRAPLILSRDLAQHLRARSGRGAIVLVASTLAVHGVAGTVAYSAAKGAVLAMTRALAAELAPDIRVNCVVPGIVDTDMMRARGDAFLREVAQGHPLGRIGTAAEVAAAIAYTLEAEWMTGTSLVIDGGITGAG